MNPKPKHTLWSLFACLFISTSAAALEAPTFTLQPSHQGSVPFSHSLSLNVEATGDPAPRITWLKDGEDIDNAEGNTLYIKRMAPYESGTYQARASNPSGDVLSQEIQIDVTIDLESQSVARWWNEFMLEAIRKDFPDPTIHSRNLYHVSAAMWDAFWLYEEEQWTRSSSVFHKEELDPTDWGADRVASQREAISHAAYSILKKRYENSPGSVRSLFGFRWLMEELGYNPSYDSVTGLTPAAVGNRIAEAILNEGYQDGSNELNNFADTSGYLAQNEPLIVNLSGSNAYDINHWQPLAFDFAVSQNGIPLGAFTQTFLGVNWREVEAFAMRKPTSNTIAFDPGPPPLFEGETKEEFRDAVVEVIRFSSYLDPSDNFEIDISPGARLNNPLGTNDGTGRGINPYTGVGYESNIVKRADYGRILAEYWADGPASETPPGHWNSLHNEITDHPLFERKYMGRGDPLPSLEWDIRAYLALNGGMHDAAVAAWTLKRQYDYSRPVTMIRHLGGAGQSSHPELASYNENGLPLIPDLIELVTEQSANNGGKHEGLAEDLFDYGRIAIKSWAGAPEDSHNEFGGVDWIWAEDWLPYQRDTFVSPAFAAYVSGHSTFSRAGAEVLTLLTGSPYFPGGLGIFHFPQNEFLEFEQGPSEDVTLQWATYYDAADQAGISRLYGGIHVRADDFVGRILGARIGVEAFTKVHALRNKAEGLNAVHNILAVSNMRSNRVSDFTRINTIGKSKKIRWVDSATDPENYDQDSIFIIHDSSASSQNDSRLKVVSNSTDNQSVEISGSIRPNAPLIIEFTIQTIEPVITLILGLSSSLENGIQNTELRFYNKEENSWAPLPLDTDWKSSEISSQIDALLKRNEENQSLETSEHAHSVKLESGQYRLELLSNFEEGRAQLSLRAQR